MKKFLLISLALLLALSMVALTLGCPTEEEQPPAEEEEEEEEEVGPTVPTGTLTVASADFGYESTDPVFYESLWGWAFYDALIRWDEDGNFVPWVAEDWELSEDGCTWTFYIRDDITFHNGDPLTAEDVKFSVDRFSDMSLSSNPWSYYLSQAYNQVETRVVSDYVFEFVADHPEPAQQVIFAWTRILPKNYYESVGMDEFRANPIGSGPWKFVEVIPETSMTLEANTDYWAEDEIPAFKYYVELEVPEQATRIAMLKNGEVDIALGIDYDRLANLEDEGFETVGLGPAGTSSICIQGSWLPDAGPMGDIRIRQAMSYALNRQEICDTWYAGYARPGGQFYMYPGCFGWSDEIAARVDPYDPEYAMDLMEQAGYPDAFDDPTIHVYTTSAGQDYHLLLIDYWQDVGLDVQLDIVDSTIYTSYFFNFTRIAEGDANVGWIFTWTYQGFFNCMYHSSNMYTSWGTHNVTDDPTADALYLKAANETDNALAYQYFNEFQLYVQSLYVNIGIVEFDTIIVVNPDTVGVWAGRNWVSYQDALNGIQHP